MMTFEEKQKRLDSVRNLRSAISTVWHKSHNTGWKLSAFNTWFTPTKHVRDSVQARINKLFAEGDEAYRLCKKLDREEDRLYALPYTSTYVSYDGTIKTYVSKGMLPDFSETSEDEKEAMQMLALYYAKQGDTKELPF